MIVVVSDSPIEICESFDAINVVSGSTVMTGPAVKRDLAFDRVWADLYAFLDDDAYVESDWLERVRRVVAANPTVAAFGGPGLMPDDQTFFEELSAATMESHIGGGPLNFRFRKKVRRFCDDFPAFNLFVRREWLERVGGWASSIYGGEDTFLCAKIHAERGEILYDPSLFVRHYRRSLVPYHSWQVYNIGRSRGCFMREGQKTSLKAFYFAPLVFSVTLTALVVLSVLPSRVQFVSVMTLITAFLAIAAFDGGDDHPLAVRLALPIGVAVQHAAYAYGLLVGLLSGRRNTTSEGARPRNRSEG